MSSDSSEEEDLSAFAEAAVPISFPNSLLDSIGFKDGKTKERVSKPSLRRKDDDDEPGHMRVTPEFQAFIAKRLSKFLDSEIREVEGTPSKKRKRRKDIEGAESGIRLLGHSSCLLTSEEEEPKLSHQRRRERKVRACLDDADDLTEEQKCREAAVSADWVLSKKAVAGWEPNTKGEVVVLKASDVVIMQGSKKGVGESGKKANGLFLGSKPQQLTDQEKKEKKKLKRFRRKERLIQQKATQLKEEESSDRELKVGKKKKNKFTSSKDTFLNMSGNSEDKNGLFGVDRPLG